MPPMFVTLTPTRVAALARVVSAMRPVYRLVAPDLVGWCGPQMAESALKLLGHASDHGGEVTIDRVEWNAARDAIGAHLTQHGVTEYAPGERAGAHALRALKYALDGAANGSDADAATAFNSAGVELDR